MSRACALILGGGGEATVVWPGFLEEMAGVAVIEAVER